MKYEYGLRLLGSAREFVASAVTSAEEHGSFNWYPSSEWKFAVVHLATALELLLKARIAIEDPLLLGAKGTITVADLESGRFRSVTIEVALRRLKQTPGSCSQISNAPRWTLSAIFVTVWSISRSKRIARDL